MGSREESKENLLKAINCYKEKEGLDMINILLADYLFKK